MHLFEASKRAGTSSEVGWLIDPAVVGDDGLAGAPSHFVQRYAYPFPEEVGEGWFEYLTIAEGVRVFRATHRFRRGTKEGFVLAGEIGASFSENTFHSATIRGGSCRRLESFPGCELILAPGCDFFRHADRFHVRQLIDTASDSEVAGFGLTDLRLGELIGEDLAAQLLDGLDLNPPPVVKIAPVPPHISALLYNTMASIYDGPVKRLYAQAKLLEYFCLLAHHLATPPKTSLRQKQRREAARQLREELLYLQGKVPRLEEIAPRYGYSVKSLNDQFIEEFGLSIYTFITQNRLCTAKAAMLESDVPMKVLAERLGYTHVNNFITAFRKAFGCTPGSLRRGSKRVGA